VDFLYRFSGVLLGCESHERESSGPPGFAILWDVNVYDFAYFPEELA
jgi:hypothetical protein